MTNKEILAKLKLAYESLMDVRENGCSDHCAGQLENGIDKLDQNICNLEEIYSDFYNTLEINELKIDSNLLDGPSNIRYVVIDRDVSGGYEIVLNDGDSLYLTCDDVHYYWYKEEKELINEKHLKEDIEF